MRNRVILLAAAIVPITALVGAATSRSGETLFADAKLIIEFNSTDKDVGVQVFLDGEPWKMVWIVNPNGRKIFEVNGRGNLKRLGLTELFFESHEPELGEMSLEEFLALFPEGDYQFFGTTVEGDSLVGTAEFSHIIPDGPVILTPEEGEEVDPEDAVVSWARVPDPPGGEIVGYQLIVEHSALRILDIKVPAGVRSITLPPEFLRSGLEYDFEVLAIEESGNQTITESFFSTS